MRIELYARKRKKREENTDEQSHFEDHEPMKIDFLNEHFEHILLNDEKDETCHSAPYEAFV